MDNNNRGTCNTNFNLAAWNIRTLLDHAKDQSTGRPERCTALISRTLAEYSIDIAALSETRLADTGDLEEVLGGYVFFWSGKSSNQRRESGVGFAVKSSLVRRLNLCPDAISDRVISLRVPLARSRYMTLISVYAPTMTHDDCDKETFYASLHSVISRVPPSDKLFVLGDFNARVGRDAAAWPGVLGRHGVGKMNSNGLLLLTKSA